MAVNGAPDPPCGGVVAGLALKAIRVKVGITQVLLAERLAVDLSTVKGWETGRRPLGHARATDIAALRFRLQLLGATSDQLAVLDEAIHADWLLACITGNEHGSHPLAHRVLTRSTNQLIAWPLTGKPPERLGLRQTQPILGTGQRDEVYAALRSAVDDSLAKANGDGGPLLRRNAYYLLAGDDHSYAWLRDAAATETRRMPRLDRWTPEWVLHRSLAVSWAVAGDRGPLHDFLERGLANDETLAASLNYWAAWCGDDPHPHVSDEFMAGDLGAWRGDVLLRSLTASLVPATAYLEMCIRAIWALLARRPQLLEDGGTAAELRQRVGELLDENGLVNGARRDLEQIDYLVKWRRA